MPSSRPEPRVGGLRKPVHGGLKPRELGALTAPPDGVIDFSASINPLGPPPGVAAAIAGVALASYPDPDCTALRAALSDGTGVAAERIVVGNGSTELIHLLARAYLRRNDCVVILTPTFGEYEMAARLSGARVVAIAAAEADGFVPDIARAAADIERLRPRLVFVCNPNNPTGVYLAQAQVAALAAATAAGFLVVDEAYVPFVADAWPATELLPLGNVVLLRSMTKDYALPGLRLGYALCPDDVAAALRLYQPTWSVNAVAQAAGLAALVDAAHLAAARRCVAEAKQLLQRELAALGLTVLPAAANFLLVKVGDAVLPWEGRARLLERGIAVRDCTSFGLPQHIRIGVRTPAECARLVAALAEVVGRG